MRGLTFATKDPVEIKRWSFVVVFIITDIVFASTSILPPLDLGNNKVHSSHDPEIKAAQVCTEEMWGKENKDWFRY